MKALRIHEYGGNLQQEEVADPAAGPGQLLVRVAATSLNPIDPGRASGQMRQLFPLEFPWIPGGDVSGVVTNVGPDVTGFKPGDAVFGYSVPGGAYADSIAIDANSAAHKPAKLTHEQAAALAVVSITAAQALALAELQPGNTILIHGGAGGVGTVAIQLAHAAGFHVVTTAKASQQDALKELGADQVIEGTESSLTGKLGPFDAVLDLVGGPLQQHLYGLVRRGGTLVTANQPPDAKQSKSAGIKSVMVQSNVTTEGLEDIARHVVAGTVRPVVKQSTSLWNPEQLWTKQPSGAAVGKTVFVADPS